MVYAYDRFRAYKFPITLLPVTLRSISEVPHPIVNVRAFFYYVNNTLFFLLSASHNEINCKLL